MGNELHHPEGFVTIDEAAAVLHRRNLTIYLMIREGKIKAVRQGRVTRLSFAEVAKANWHLNGIPRKETLPLLERLIRKPGSGPGRGIYARLRDASREKNARGP